MALDQEYDDIVKKVKLGKASAEAQAYLGGWLQKRCEAVWQKFLMCKPDLSEMLALQAEGKVVAEWQRDLILTARASRMARERFAEKYNKQQAKK